MEVVELSKKIEDIVTNNDLTRLSYILQRQFAISKSDELQKAIDVIKTEGRILKLGIIGRVKAGKSSILNALLFDGQSVLPKAATPMTAALTILQYGEETKADVEFFGEKDIDDIKKMSEEYENILENTKNNEYEKLKIRSEKQKKEEKEEEIAAKALRLAKQEVGKDEKLTSSYEQYQKIKNSNVAQGELSGHQTIKANSLDELNSGLLEFVGADGRFMPFTKSVTLTINHESLRDIEIIDTPGVNDPITSREERTREALKYCDVVLVVSPGGQFLSAEDLGLMDKITSREGIKDIYIVASKIDNQLFGSEKESGNGILQNVLNGIEDKLTKMQQDILGTLKYENPEVGNTFDSLIKNRVILSSAVCHGMMKRYHNQSTWDANEQKVLENLNFHYRDFFSDDSVAISNLKKLANIEKITTIIDEIRAKKEIIIQRRAADFEAAKRQALMEYKAAIEQDLKMQFEKIKNSDIDEIKQKKAEIEQFKAKAIYRTNETYLDCVEKLESVKWSLFDKFRSLSKKSANDMQDHEGTETESWTTKEGGLFGCFQDTILRHATYTTVRAGAARTSLEELTRDIDDTIGKEAKGHKGHICNWREESKKQLIKTLRDEAGDDRLDTDLISKAVRSILNSIDFPDITYSDNFPESLKKSGTLKGSEAKEYIKDAENYISHLHKWAREDIGMYIKQLTEKLGSYNIGKDIFKEYETEIAKLAETIEEKEMSLDRLTRTIKQLEAIHA